MLDVTGKKATKARNRKVSLALGILAETAKQSRDPEQQALYQQTMAALQQMQADEP
jgi:hypothetical protein